MNSLFKYLVLSTLVVLIASNASALAVFDLNVWDANGSVHANKGEDFNVGVLAANAATADVNTDFNYMIALNYNGTYLDLNINVVTATMGRAGGLTAVGDGNVVTKTLSGSGPCASAGDTNVLVLDTVGDTNTFMATVTLPTDTTGTNINYFVGKEVTVELWKIIDTGTSTATCLGMDANHPFIVGPAIIVQTPNPSNYVGAIEQSITVMGFGFDWNGGAFWNSGASDLNVEISFWDANATRMYAKSNKDLNIQNVSSLAKGKYRRGGYSGNIVTFADTNDMVMSTKATKDTLDVNGVRVIPDANGEFDVNITIPVFSTSAGGTIGRRDLNTLRASSRATGDVNADVFVIAPRITMESDLNVTVTISGRAYDLNTAILSNLITNMAAVSGVIVRMGRLVTGTGDREIMVKFNSDINFYQVNTRSYATDMNGRMGWVAIDSTNVPELSSVDANVFMYLVGSNVPRMPTIVRNGLPCATTTCKNLDGTSLSDSYHNSATDAYSWIYDTNTGDGNMAFRVSSFSTYEASTFNVEMLTPVGGDRWRVEPGNGKSYRISFRFTDSNASDSSGQTDANRGIPLKAALYLSDYAGGQNITIINDTNLFDDAGIDCNTGNNLWDMNMNYWQTCVFDWNAIDMNHVFGEFMIDVNLSDNKGDRTVRDTTDENIFVNPPRIVITDLNFMSANFSIDDYKNAVKYGSASLDKNYMIDFNIFIPDTNTTGRTALSDYNVTFYFSTTPFGTAGNQLYDTVATIGIDFNLSTPGNNLWTSGGMTCTQPVDLNMDYNCTYEWDTNAVIEKKGYLIAKIVNKTTRTVSMHTGVGTWVASVVDANELWDVNATPYAFSVNDGNAPRSPSQGDIIVEGTRHTFTIPCDDNTSGAKTYFYRQVGDAWSSNGTSSTLELSTTSSEEITYRYQTACLDYANNTSDINGISNITFRPGGSHGETRGGGTPIGPGGGGTPAEPEVVGTETTVSKEVTGMPTVTDIQTTLQAAGYTALQIAAAQETAANTPVTQSITVEKTTMATGALRFNTTVGIAVKNTSSEKWTNVKVVVEIPKAVARNAADVTSTFAMNVLKADPIIEFTVPQILPGQTVEVLYEVANNVSEATADSVPLGMVTAYMEAEPCEGVICPAQECKAGTCNPGTELCEYTNVADGTACQGTKECRGGVCQAKPVVTPPVTPPAQPDNTALYVAAVIVIILIVGGGYYYTTTKGKKKK